MENKDIKEELAEGKETKLINQSLKDYILDKINLMNIKEYGFYGLVLILIFRLIYLFLKDDLNFEKVIIVVFGLYFLYKNKQ